MSYVLIVGRGLPSNKYKTYGIFEYNYALELHKNNVKVIYVALDFRSPFKFRKIGLQKSTKDGFVCYNYNFPLGRLGNSKLLALLINRAKKLLKIIYKENGLPSVIHSHFTIPSYIFLKANGGNIPLIVTEHSSKILRVSNDQFLYKIANEVYKHANKVTAVSDYFSSFLSEKFNLGVTTVNNIMNVDAFKMNESSQKNSEQVQICFTGNLIKSKGIYELLDSFEKLVKESPESNILLNIFGDGPERKNIEKMLKSKNLINNVCIHGIVSHADIAKVYNKSAFFVLPSYFETFGVSYIEAMASGLPVIGTNCGGPSDFIDKSNGILVKDIELLPEALIRMKDSFVKYDREKISKNIIERYRPQNTVNQLLNLYTEVSSKA